MAFDVTPTSGAGPYDFTAVIASAIAIDNVKYSLLFQSTTTAGSCPVVGSAANVVGGATSILATGTYTATLPVPIGSCRAYTLRVRDNDNGTFISEQTVQVSNLA